MRNLRLFFSLLCLGSLVLGASVWRSETVWSSDVWSSSFSWPTAAEEGQLKLELQTLELQTPVATPPADDQTEEIVLDLNAPNALASGTLTASDATFNRPNSNCAALSGNATRFDAIPFTVTTAGTKTISFEAADGGSITPNGTDGAGPDTFLVLYNGAFNPASPLTNCSTINDDINGASNRRSRISANLAAGTYTAVITAFNAVPTTTTGDAALPWTYSLAINGGVTLTVTKTADTNDGVCDADCSLREAIARASAGDAIAFAGGVTGTIPLSLGSLNISKNLTIDGPGANLLTISGSGNGPNEIFTVNGGVTFNLSGVTLSGVNRPANGGAITNSGTLNLSNSSVRLNTANNGAGIFNFATLSIVNCSFSANTTSGGGGGVFNQGTITISNSTFSGNTAAGNGGGGAISTLAGTATITNTTISNNSANSGTSGGGILNQATLNLRNTIVANNTSGSGGPDINGSVASQGFNLIENTTGATISGTTASNITGIDPNLGPLADNGGPTFTHALLGGSPALDKGSNSGSPLPTTDQRGQTRVVDLTISNASGGDGTDIGAFESAAIPTCIQAATPITFGQTLNGTLAPGDCHFTVVPPAAAGNSGSLYDAYTFSGTAGQQIAIAMTSTLPVGSGGFDTVLRLYQGSFPGGTFVTENDDIDSGNNRNSRIPVTGFFTLPATGTYTIVANAFSTAGVGDYTLNLTLADTTAPTAVGTAPNVTTAGGTTHTASVVYSDNVGISSASIGTADISITGPGGLNGTVTGSNFSPSGTGGTGTYTFSPPGGSWDFADNGTYNIVMQTNQVADTSGNFVAAGTIGTFTVNIPASPQTFIVTNLNNDGPGSLRQAILDANANSPAADTINFQAGLTGTITLGAPGEMVISDSVTINGPGASVITVSGSNASRVFSISAGSTVSISGLTVSGGNGAGANASGRGGAIFSLGALTIANCVISQSSGTIGGGVSSGVLGSGISLSVSDCTISGNTADNGGGILVSGGTVNVARSTISGNLANFQGGGLNFQNASGAVTNSTISGNTANSATFPGAVFVFATTGSRTVQLVNSTIANNLTGTPNTVGGLLVIGEGAGVTATASLRNSIIANNASINLLTETGGGGGVGTITSQGYNLASDGGGGFLTGTGDQINTNPLLGPLANNGGPTQTHALLAGSPAIDKGSNAGSGVTTDQRGLTRPRDLVAIGNAVGGDGSDIGAYEEQNEPAATPPTAVGTSPNVSTSGVTSQTVTVTYTDDVAIDVSTLGTGDITVTGPAPTATPTFVSFNPGGNGTPRTAIYTFTPVTGAWRSAFNGTYNIVMQANQVADTAGAFVPAGQIGSFSVNVPNGQIGGLVWSDNDADGVQDPGEPVIIATTVFIDSNSNGVRDLGEPGSLSNSQGRYTFNDLAPGTYRLGVSTVALGFQPTTPSFLNVTLSTPGQIIDNANFGFRLNVTNLSDSGPGSLRQAILTANQNPPPGAETIVFQAGLTGTITLTSDQLSITDSVTINGPGAGVISVSGNNARRVFETNAGTTVSISGLTITNGSVSGDGGGIRAFGTLNLSNCAVTNNTATGFSGGIDVNLALTVTNCTISGNTANNGGGIASVGTVNIVGSTISGNTAAFQGGGLNLQFTNTTITNSTISGNTANTPSPNAGGGISFGGSSGSFTLQINNSTLANNLTATANSGGGLSVVSDGGVYTALLRNSIVAGNASPNLRTQAVSGGTATITSQGFNLTNDPTNAFLNQSTDQFNTNPLLGPLASNGGPTQTHALLVGSPAIDKGSNAGSGVTTDQRGQQRPRNLVGYADVFGGDTSDIGAYEEQTEPTAQTLVVTNLNDSGAGSLRQAILNSNATSGVVDTINFQPGLTGTITLTSGELVIRDSVAINGPGAGVISVSGNNASRVIQSINSFTVAISGLTITGGRSNGGGGGIRSDSALTISNSVVSGNSLTSGAGGGISSGGPLTIINSTISGNTAVDDGGGIIFDNTSANLTISNSTISGNTVTSTNNSQGGGIWVQAAAANITNSTITNNSIAGAVSASGLYRNGGSVTLRNTIVAGNQSNSTKPDVVANGGTGITSGGYNLIGNPASLAIFNQTGDQVGTAGSPLNPLLGPLAINGGPTQTHALLAGSPAIDKGSNSGSPLPTTDQRGSTRPRDLIAISNAVGGDGSDIGAYEEQNEPSATPTPTPTATPTPTPTPTATPTPTPPPSSIVVINTNDSGPGSLRQAIADVASGGTITFSSLFSGPEEMNSPDAPQTIVLTSGELIISKNLTITGPGSGILTVSGNNASRVFRVVNTLATITVNISGVTITGGNSPQEGGGIYQQTLGTLTVTDSVISNNTAPQSGGGIYITGDAILQKVSISGNLSQSAGGGIFCVIGCSLNVSDSTVSGNSATGVFDGGGIQYNSNGNLTITNSTISGNSTSGPNAGGLGAARGNVTISNSTFTGNSAATNGGGISNSGPAIITLRSSIVAGNTAPTNPDVRGTFATENFNLIGINGTSSFVAGTPNANSSQVGTTGTPINPLLGPLQINGGTTPTHSLLSGSPAIDGGNSFGSINDQRGPGFLRVVDLLAPNASGGDGADIGALELQSEPPPATATIQGRVLRPAGQALANTRVFLTDQQGVRVGLATTSSFGIFTFTNVPTGQTYFITVSSKRFRYAPQTVSVNGNISGLDLVGLE